MGIHVSGASETAAAFRAAAAEVDPLCAQEVAKVGLVLQGLVRAKASTGFHKPGDPHIPGTGPGPNVATGDYRRGITMTPGRSTVPTGRTLAGGVGTIRTAPSATVFTNDARGPRLEHGFFGTDSAGRHYKAPAYPHFGPAADEIEPKLQGLLDTTVVARVVALANGEAS